MITECDVFIIGGGINGTGIARDASGRGQKVVLVEKNDLAGATSSASTKLIHGGLRYLEHYEFGLVRESLQERERLWSIAPHLISAMRFVLPHHSELRPAWLVRLGLFLYDHIGGRKRLPATQTLSMASHSTGEILQTRFKKAFEYSDCWVDDARLVVANAMSASELGAKILTRTEFKEASRVNGCWLIKTRDENGVDQSFEAKAIVNAAGAWVKPILASCNSVKVSKSTTLLVKGSHIVVPKLYDHGYSYTFQSGDGRVIFVIPYEDDFTLIGTTDQPYEEDLSEVSISDEEATYLCQQVSGYLKKPLRPEDVVWSYSGVRPLYNDGSGKTAEATRDYVLEVDALDNKAPILTIFGGKITTYRRLAEDVLKKLEPHLDYSRGAWTATEALAGGNISNDSPATIDPADAMQRFAKNLITAYPGLQASMLKRLALSYGNRVHTLLSGVSTSDDLGLHFGADLYEREVQYLMKQEWAKSGDDILWRRSKLGLRLTPQQRGSVSQYVRNELGY